MTRQFGTTTIEDLYMALDELKSHIENLENRKDTILPQRDKTNLPPGQEGQIVIGNQDSAFPVSSSPRTAYIFANNEWQQVGGGLGGGVTLKWIFVGTTGVDGIDTLLAANPHPYATGDSPGPVPFTNGTTALANPLAFATLDAALFLTGGFTGVTTGQSIFSLPASFTPISNQPIEFIFSDFSGIGAANVQSNSQVIYKGKSTLTFT